jgi:hypothetical protein
MIRRCAIAAFAARERGKKACDACTKVNGQAENRAQLDHDGVHLPEAVAQVNAQQGLGNSEMRS